MDGQATYTVESDTFMKGVQDMKVVLRILEDTGRYAGILIGIIRISLISFSLMGYLGIFS